MQGSARVNQRSNSLEMPCGHQIWVVVVLRSPIHANEPSEYNGMLYRTSNRVLNNGIKVIILICMDGTSQYHHHPNLAERTPDQSVMLRWVKGHAGVSWGQLEGNCLEMRKAIKCSQCYKALCSCRCSS